MDWEEQLKNNLHLFTLERRHWTPEEMYIVYKVYNGYYNSDIRDTGCGSCRRSVVSHCRKIAADYKKKFNTE
jgi:hypothetical protein